MTLPEVGHYFESWKDAPPTHIAVGAILGAFIVSKPEISDSDIAEIAKSMPVVRGKDSGLPKAAPIIDFDAMREKNRERVALRAAGGRRR